MKHSQLTLLDRQICGNIWTSPYIRELMEVLSYDIGPRPPGSKTMCQAQNFLAEVLCKLGAGNVHTESVPVFAWRHAPSHVQILSPYRRTFESFHYVHSAMGRVSAEVLNVGSANDEELDRLGRRIQGAIVFIHGQGITGAKWVPPPQYIRKVAERGAAAAIICTAYQIGCPAIGLAGTSEDVSIPVVGISYEDGRELTASDRRKPYVQIDTDGRSYSTKCANLVAELGCARAADEVILLGAHLDTFYVSPGAWDNLTGVITLVEIARALAPMRLKFRRRLRLCLFTGEEYGFVGSKSYVRRNAAHLNHIQFAFNMDSLLPSTAENVAVMWAPRMRNYINQVFTQTQYQVNVQNLFCMSSDYLPFMLAGIAAGRPAHFGVSSAPPWTHTRMDTPDKIPLDWICKNAMVFASLILRLLTDPRPLPVKRKSSAEVQALLTQENVLDALRIYGFDL